MRVKAGTWGLCAVLVGIGGCAAFTSDGSPSGEATATTQSAVSGGDGDGDGRCRDLEGNCSVVHAQIVATGIPGAGAIAQVGYFHRGDAIHDSPALNTYLQPGQVWYEGRVLVASTSNFGEPIQNPGQFPGSVISIDPTAGPVAVPADFASAGDQVSALGGALIMWTANNAAFLNGRFNPKSVTPNEVGASLCTGLSINNGNGRPWLSCSPNGTNGYSTITVLDPDGAPLNGAPDAVAGGVFAGNLTNRTAATTHGLTAGALGLAVMTKSSDGTGKAVFASREVDGSIEQIHVAKGVDGLVPAGTLTPMEVSPEALESTDPHVVSRTGMAFNWVPNHTLYVADPLTNQLVAFDIGANGTVFTASAPRYIKDHHFNVPVDVSPTVPEIGSEAFASNTTLGAAADLYVLNRGDNTIVRINQNGEIKGVRALVVDGLDDFRVNGIGVSPDGKDVWVSATTPNRGGVVLHVPGFGSGPIMPKLMSDAAAAGATTPTQLGTHFFMHQFTVDEGVGPLFNAQACVGCHDDPAPGGMGNTAVDVLVGEFENGTFEPLEGDRGPTARQHAISQLGATWCGLQPPGTPPDTNAFSPRSAMTLRGTSLLDFILDQDILKNQATEPATVQGHPNILADGRIGRFGWKADNATLVEFMGHAMRNEIGETNNLAPKDEVNGCGANVIKPEIDSVPLETIVTFLQTIDPKDNTATCNAMPGAASFHDLGCDGCHTPQFNGPGFPVHLYSDLLLHDMGPAMADGFVDNSASGSEFRTMTLADMADRTHFLHDGRAHTIADAIKDHGGQAAAAAAAFENLSASDQAALLAFVGCL